MDGAGWDWRRWAVSRAVDLIEHGKPTTAAHVLRELLRRDNASGEAVRQMGLVAAAALAAVAEEDVRAAGQRLQAASEARAAAAQDLQAKQQAVGYAWQQLRDLVLNAAPVAPTEDATI